MRPLAGPAQIQDDHAPIRIVFALRGFGGGVVHVLGDLHAGLIVLIASAALLFLTTADLVDDEGRQHDRTHVRDLRRFFSLL